MNLSPISSRHNSIDLSVDAEYTKQLEKQKSAALFKKIGDVVYEILGYIPVIGTFIGAHHLYKAVTEGKRDGWELFQIIVQFNSFLVVPQIIYGIACAVDAIHTKRQEEQAAREDLKNALNNAFQGTQGLGEALQTIDQNRTDILKDILKK